MTGAALPSAGPPNSPAAPLPDPPPSALRFPDYSTPTHPPGAFRGAIEYLRARPILVLLLLSPGIPEYLSGSSPLNAVVTNPAWFLLQIGLNLGLYGPGVLLIREASIRWNKSGMVPVLLLGAAYGILEEGIALSTMFNPNASVVGSLGEYGHFLGVNTVWVPGVLMVHMVFSIGLPIFLLGIALPETRGQSLIGRRGLAAAFAILAADVAILFCAVLFGMHFWMTWPILLGSFAVIAGLVYLAYRWPAPAPATAPGREIGGLWGPALAGAALFPAIILAQGLGQTFGAAPFLVIAVVILLQLLVGAYAYRWLRGPRMTRRQLAFALGLLAPIASLGFIAQFPIEIVAVADAALVVWFLRMLRAAESEVRGDRSASPPPLGAGSGAI